MWPRHNTVRRNLTPKQLKFLFVCSWNPTPLLCLEALIMVTFWNPDSHRKDYGGISFAARPLVGQEITEKPEQGGAQETGQPGADSEKDKGLRAQGAPPCSALPSGRPAWTDEGGPPKPRSLFIKSGVLNFGCLESTLRLT